MPSHQKMYGTFSLWDTYRTVHPLMNLVHPEESADFGHSLLRMAQAWGSLPPWQLMQSPTDMMEGDGGSIVLSTLVRDGYLNASEAYGVLQTTRWQTDINKVPKVSAWLEQARADNCMARLEQRATKKEAAQSRFEKRADSIFKLWDSKHHIFVAEGGGRGMWDSDVNTISLQDQYTEGTPLQYSWAAEWQLDRLTQLHGGRDKMTCALDNFFYKAPNPRGFTSDVTGNMHGFTQGDEPDFHVPYLYSMLGRPSKTQAVVDALVKDMFSALEDGLPGNDDLGAMSSWLVLSMLGVYPANVCGDEVALGRPFVTMADLRVRHGTLRIRTHNQSDEHKYVEKLTWNGKDLDAGREPSGGVPLTLPWSELHQGGELVFWMTSEAPADNLQC